MILAIRCNGENLREAGELRVTEFQGLPWPPAADQAQANLSRARADDTRFRAVRIDDGRGTGREQRIEQTKHCRAIGFQRVVIVEMIAREVGERAGREPYAVE